MKKEKSFNNCILFDSTLNPCPNKDKQYISDALKIFRSRSPDSKNIISEDIIHLANEICKSCE
jgi:hypothetical protein